MAYWEHVCMQGFLSMYEQLHLDGIIQLLILQTGIKKKRKIKYVISCINLSDIA